MTKETNKPQPIRVKGTGIFEGNDFTFRPSEPGEPAQRDVRAVKGGKLFTTTSAKNPLQVAHLSCAADAADPYSEYVERLHQLGIRPLSEQQLPERQRLVNEGGVQVYLNTQKGRLTYQGDIELTANGNWQSELMRQLQVVVRTLPADKKFTTALGRIKKGGRK